MGGMYDVKLEPEQVLALHTWVEPNGATVLIVDLPDTDNVKVSQGDDQCIILPNGQVVE